MLFRELWRAVLILAMTAGSGMTETAKTVRLVLPPGNQVGVDRVAAVFSRQVRQRSAARVVTSGTASLRVVLALQPGIGPDGFTISDSSNGSVCISGDNARGLLYGVGKFLRSARYGEDGFTPGTWRGTSVPVGRFRGLYCATHFMNYYEAAPAEEIRHTIEDIALWGVNTLIVAFPPCQFTGFDDPKARKNLKRLHEMHAVAKKLGLSVGLALCPNQGFITAPETIRAKRFPDDLKRRGFFGVNICPSNPAGRQYLLDLDKTLFEKWKTAALDYLVFWPYDEGGCGCRKCWPWGARGYPHLARDVTLLARSRFPSIKTVLSTWCYDTPPAGEWKGLAALLEKDPSWLTCIMADAHEDFPRYPLDVGVPGGLPLVNFPEISMWGQSPWGGYGANPLPRRLQRLWRQTEGKVSGGMPYSEGIYEDINKAICQQFYWAPDRPAAETVREYVSFEFSPDVADDLVEVVRIFEANHRRNRIGKSALRALELVENAQTRLTQETRRGWRWRIFYLRARIDAEIFRRQGKLEGPVLKQAFAELTTIYHAGHSHSMPIRPPQVE